MDIQHKSKNISFFWGTRLLGIGFLFSLSFFVNANSDFTCSSDTTKDSQFFKQVQEMARAIEKRFCAQLTSKIPKEKIEFDELLHKTTEFGGLVSQILHERFPEGKWEFVRWQADNFEKVLSLNRSYPDKLPPFHMADKSSLQDGVKKSFFFGNKQSGKVILITDSNNNDCEHLDPSKPKCDIYFEDLLEAVFPYQMTANAYGVQNAIVLLEQTSEAWDRYFEKGRYQNSAGIALTTVMERDHFEQDYLVGPPTIQWHALQPTLVIENVDDARDGDNVEYAVGIEWIGMNWWEDSFFGIPFGFSFTSVYADRPEVEDLGHGVMLHFDNKYTIGVTDHDGDQGIFVTLDLLKSTMNKKEQLDKYLEDLRSP